MRNRGLNAKLRQISKKLSDIMEQDTDEKVMAFTDNRALQELCAQINRLLADRREIKADYRKKEISYKKMLSNISHDIKTPLTVILGYLEMMRLADGQNEELRKVEAKAGQVMELIDQFFTLAKLEAGDMELEIGAVNISELCRESMLGYYDILQGKDFTVGLSIPGRQPDFKQFAVQRGALWQRRKIHRTFPAGERRKCVYRHNGQGQGDRESFCQKCL